MSSRKTRITALAVSVSMLFGATAPAFAATEKLLYRVPYHALDPNSAPPGKLEFAAPGSIAGVAGVQSSTVLTLRNSGGRSVTPTAASIAASTSSVSLEDHCVGLKLAPKATCDIEVFYTPSQAGSYPSNGVAVSATPTGAATVNVALSATANPASAGVTALSVTPSTILANGTAAAVATVQLADAYGNVLGAGIPVTWSVSPAGALLSASTTATDANGQATVRMTATTAQAYVLGAKASSSDPGKQGAVTASADAATAHIESVTTSATSVANDNTTVATLRAKVVDANNNIVTGVPVTWSTTLGTLSAVSGTTDTTGYVQTTIKSASTGTATISATGPTGAAQSTSVTFKSMTPSVTVTATNNPMRNVAGQTSTVTATITDPDGNPMANRTVTWVEGSGGAYMKLSGQTLTTDANGRVTGTLTPVTTIAGPSNITVKDVASGKQSFLTVATTGDPSTMKISALNTSLTTAPADGTTLVNLSAAVRDAKGYQIVAQPVTFSQTVGVGTPTFTPGAVVNSDTSGQGQTKVTANRAGSKTFQARLSNGQTATVVVNFTGNPNTLAPTAFTATNSAPYTANGNPATFSVTAKDADGVLVPNGVVNFSATNGATLSRSTATLDASGVATGMVWTLTKGAVTVKVWGADPNVNKTLTFTFN